MWMSQCYTIRVTAFLPADFLDWNGRWSNLDYGSNEMEGAIMKR